ncbi:hypothetical protein [Haloarcula amylovorans]|uniref:hypothetical protein n=1 Tax=Haloarcula amylovorans TaxID=2562280 RepID=UPI0010768BAC|nr:hypothetical protein [Halomicroarcula amylolytica]
MSKSDSPTSKPVGTTDPNPQEQRARELLTQRPTFLGTDGNDYAHYWDSYEYAVAVVAPNGNAEKHALDETAYANLSQWCEHVRDKRGWETGPHVGGSLVDDLVEALR